MSGWYDMLISFAWLTTTAPIFPLIDMIPFLKKKFKEKKDKVEAADILFAYSWYPSKCGLCVI